MSRRSVCVALACLACLAGGAGAALVALVRHEPRHYARAPLPADEARRHEQAQRFQERFLEFYGAVGGEEPWGAEFSDEQINSFFEDGGGFAATGLDKGLLAEGISRPRVVFEPDRVRLAFRYGSGLLRTTLSIDLRVWLPRCEPNVLALELEGLHAGALPVAA